MRSILALLFWAATANAAQAALVTFNFTAVRTFVEAEVTTVTGLVDALRGESTISGSIIFDTTRIATSNLGGIFDVYAKSTVQIDGADTSSANSRMLRTAVGDRGIDHQISTSYRGSISGTAETYDFAVFEGNDRTFSIYDGDPAFPDLLPPPGADVSYIFTFRSVFFDGSSFVANEGIGYRLTSFTRDAPAALNLPGSGLLVLSGLGALALVRRRQGR